jgi:ABC-2 type transport system permease protein
MPGASEAIFARAMVGRAAIKEAICYPADVVIGFISYPIAFIGYFFFVAAISAEGGQLGGATMSHLITYFSIAWLLRMVVDQGVDGDVAGEVQSGDIALALVRPLPLASYFFARFAGLGLARLVYYGVPAALLLGFLFGDDMSIAPERLVWFVPYVVIAFRLAFELQFLLGLLAFFIYVNRQVSWSVDMMIRLLSGLIVPLNLFPAQVAAWLEALPFQYLYYRPIQALLGPAAPGTLLAGLGVGLCWVLAFRALNRWVLARALRRHVIYGS